MYFHAEYIIQHMKQLLLLCLLISFSNLKAQFTSDSTLNLTIQDQSGSEQATPLIASRADGGAYISWFDQSTGNYVLRMQRLDALGNKLWGPNGLVVSNATQSTALFRYDLKTDNDGNAVVAFQDTRTGNLQVVVQKLDSSGIAFFATNGIVLIDADAGEGLAPTIGILGNNNIIIAWNAYQGSSKWVSYYELNPITGAPINGIATPGRIKSPTIDYGRPYVLPLDTNQYYLMYIEETGTFPGVTSKIYMNRVTSGYINNWSAPKLVTSKTITFFFFPTLISDGGTGALVAFNSSNPTNAALTSVYLQHVDSAGTLWSATGTPLTTSTTIQSYLGGYFYRGDFNQTWIALQVTNTGQSQAGISLQRVDANGTKLSGGDGIVIEPQSANIFSPATFTQNDANGTIIYKVGLFGAEEIYAVNVDSNAVKTWSFGESAVCVNQSNKDDIGITPMINQQMIITWSDDRIDNGIYAQNLNANGTIGPVSVGLNSVSTIENTIQIINPSSVLQIINTNSRLGITEIEIFDSNGKIVLHENVNKTGSFILPEATILNAGLYFVRMNKSVTLKWMKE